jgi:argininosuccinate lyase
VSTLWHGRFGAGPAEELLAYTASLPFDQRLAADDITGSRAHVRGLVRAGLLDADEAAAVLGALDTVADELAGGSFSFVPSDEDIHTAVERRLTELTPAGAVLHTGRSRNDQIALDLRLYCRVAASELVSAVAGLVDALSSKARMHSGWLMPGYTHLQRAQPITVGHHLLAHAEPLLRDAERYRHAYDAAGEMPLGSGALAATTLPLQRDVVRRELGFERLTANSIDAVSDRDFALDLVYACTSTSIHLSRFAEDVIIWASSEFGFVRLADEVSTGSSAMPQKKNPDIPELLRGRAGRGLGSLVSLATVLKGLPLAYDRDLQEDKPSLFAAVDNAIDSLEAATILVQHLEFDRQKLGAAASDPDLLATDAAEALVATGVPFRKAYDTVGRQVMDGTMKAPWNARASVAKRDVPGGPNPRRVAARATAVRREAVALQRWSEGHPRALPS